MSQDFTRKSFSIPSVRWFFSGRLEFLDVPVTLQFFLSSERQSNEPSCPPEPIINAFLVGVKKYIHLMILFWLLFEILQLIKYFYLSAENNDDNFHGKRFFKGWMMEGVHFDIWIFCEWNWYGIKNKKLIFFEITH